MIICDYWGFFQSQSVNIHRKSITNGPFLIHLVVPRLPLWANGDCNGDCQMQNGRAFWICSCWGLYYLYSYSSYIVTVTKAKPCKTHGMETDADTAHRSQLWLLLLTGVWGSGWNLCAKGRPLSADAARFVRSWKIWQWCAFQGLLYDCSMRTFSDPLL